MNFEFIKDEQARESWLKENNYFVTIDDKPLSYPCWVTITQGNGDYGPEYLYPADIEKMHNQLNGH